MMPVLFDAEWMIPESETLGCLIPGNAALVHTVPVHAFFEYLPLECLIPGYAVPEYVVFRELIFGYLVPRNAVPLNMGS